jgi:CRISPR/Cas system-associated exonuclease Cas4 (RecB family)
MLTQQEFISTDKKTHNIKVVTKSGLLWDTAQQKAIEKVNLIHDILSKIKIKDDIDFVINDFVDSDLINLKQSVILKDIVINITTHPELKDYYTSNFKIYNERDIITKNGIILRPDRVVLNSKNEAIIIDYKTGIEDKKHKQQLLLYQDVLESMNIKVKKKILVYINEDIHVMNVNFN